MIYLFDSNYNIILVMIEQKKGDITCLSESEVICDVVGSFWLGVHIPEGPAT